MVYVFTNIGSENKKVYIFTSYSLLLCLLFGELKIKDQEESGWWQGQMKQMKEW